MQNVSVLSRFMKYLSQTHYIGAKRILRYLKDTGDFGVWYTCEDEGKLIGFSYSD